MARPKMKVNGKVVEKTMYTVPVYKEIFGAMEPPACMTPSEIDEAFGYAPGTAHDMIVLYWQKEAEVFGRKDEE